MKSAYKKKNEWKITRKLVTLVKNSLQNHYLSQKTVFTLVFNNYNNIISSISHDD